jgi:hypothetical protein
MTQYRVTVTTEVEAIDEDTAVKLALYDIQIGNLAIDALTIEEVNPS